METDYYIVGSGGFAKEVYFLAEKTLGNQHNFKGFIDKEPEESFIKVRGAQESILDENEFLDQIKPSKQLVLFMGIGDPKILMRLSSVFKDYEFPNLIAKSAIYDEQSVRLGRGNIITDGCIFTVDIQIGSFNVFNLGVTIGHDTQIDSANIFNPGSNISGSVVIGNANLFGTNATVLQNLSIGSENILGAASLANRGFEDNQIMVGVPAKNIKKN